MNVASHKPVVGYEKYYTVSSTGEVLSLGGRRGARVRLLRPHNIRGYQSVDLCVERVRRGHLIHRVVAEAFIPNPSNLPYVNHLDGDKSNNNVSNLEWCDHLTNMQHAWRTGLMSKVGVLKRGES